MEIARATPLSILFSFDPKSLLRQIVDGLVREFRGAPEPASEPQLALAVLPSLAYPARRQQAYAPRWG